jgi:hypothetical protein
VSAIVYVGDRVRVTSFWHAFYALKGTVVSLQPRENLMVLLDGYQSAFLFGKASVEVIESRGGQ